MLLILTSDKDLTADFLIVELLERQLPYFRVNAEDLSQCGYEFSDSGTSRITVGPRSVDLAEVTAVWYRRALFPITSVGDSYAERAFVAGEIRHLAFGMVWNPDILWVNPIDRVYVAEHKIHQLVTAKRLGFNVPRTIVSSDVKELKAFARSNPDGTICKPIYHGLFLDGPDSYSVYTRQVSAEDFDGHENVDCPVLLQEKVTRRCDLRVTFIGKHCFTAAVRTPSPCVDWRDPAASAAFSPAEIEPDLKAKCREMLSSLGLRYGAFDFILRPDGEEIFLEVNPTGEWAWLENSLGFPMRSAFINISSTESKMRNPFLADPPKAIGWRSLPGHLLHLVKSVTIQVGQVFIPFKAEPQEIPDFPETMQGDANREETVKQCQWIFDQAEQRRNQLEQKAQSSFSLMVFLVPILTSFFVYVVGKAKSGSFRQAIIGLICVAGLFLLLAFISAIRAIGVKSNQTLSLDLVIDANGAFLPHDEVRHAKGLLYCASINTAKNDHLAQFVRGTHSMTAIAIIFVILAAIPTSFTVAAQSEDTARTTIVGPVQVAPTSSPSDATKDENTKLNERLRSLENRVGSMESRQAGHGRRGQRVDSRK